MMLRPASLWASSILALGVLAAGPGKTQQAHTIEITGFTFVPEARRVHVGDTIVFVNKDVVPHTATQRTGGWDSGALARDRTWSMRVEAAGTFDYFCRFHPSMKGSLAVE